MKRWGWLSLAVALLAAALAFTQHAQISLDGAQLAGLAAHPRIAAAIAAARSLVARQPTPASISDGCSCGVSGLLVSGGGDSGDLDVCGSCSLNILSLPPPQAVNDPTESAACQLDGVVPDCCT